MRVAYIGNFGVSFSTESHVALSLESLGHHVSRHQENEVDWAFVPVHAEAGEYDFVLWTHTHGFADESKHDACLEYLAACRSRGIPTVGYHLDKWWGLEREAQTTEPFFQQDIVCTADGGHAAEWAAIGTNHVWMPPAVVHTEVGRGNARSDWRGKVGFVGGWKNYGHDEVWPWRRTVVGETFRRYGSAMRLFPQGAAVRGWDLNDVYAGLDVVLGDSCLAGGATHYWSDRVPETLGRGGFLLHPTVQGLAEAFDGCPLPATYNVGDLAQVWDLIDYWADAARAGERREMTDEAIEFVRKHHTYRVRMSAVCALVEAWRQR